MASYFNITLDTLAPQGLTVKLNNGSQYTTSKNVTLSLSVSDTSTSGYQMKVWGIDGASSEDNATWETYAPSKSITLLNNDGLKTVYVKVRDDVCNETAAASATITLDTSVPAVTIIGPDVSRISKTAPKNVATFSFTCDVDVTEWEARATRDGESSGRGIGLLVESGTSLKTGNAGVVSVLDSELSKGDGDYLIRIYAKSNDGVWSG